MQEIPEVKELTGLLRKLGTFRGQYIDVVKNNRDKSFNLYLEINMNISTIKYEKLLKFLDEL